MIARHLPGQLTRRQLLKAGAGLQLGLVMGLGGEALLVLAREGEPFDADPDQQPSLLPSAWLSIAADESVTVRVHKSEMGQGVRTGLAMVLAEELDVAWEQVKVEQAPTDPSTYGSHSTAGSGSTSGNYQNLRRVGAAARWMLIQAAARRWGVDAGSCSTEAGKVIHAGSRRQLSYGSLADEAGRLSPPDPAGLRLKNPADFRIVGRPTRRVDTPDIVTGRARYSADVRLPNMVFAVIARCPIPGGRVASFDEAAALAVPGVLRVLPVNRGVAVIGQNTWAALRGREALAVRWNGGANAGLTDAGIHETLRQAMQTAPALPAGRQLSAAYSLPYLPHAAMEPLCCVADVRADGADLWVPSQNPGDIQRTVANGTGLPLASVRVHLPLLGGSFGRNASSTAIETVNLSRSMGRPVLLTFTREDDLQLDAYRPASQHLLRASLDGGGQVLAWQHRGAMAGGQAGERELTPPYTVGGLDLHMSGASIPIATGAWRSVIHSALVFVNESFIDELAHAAGADPLAYRRRFLGNRRVQGALDRAAAEIGWGAALPAGEGLGIACAACFGSYVATAVHLVLEGPGLVRLKRVVVAVDCGLAVNPLGVTAQIQGATVDGLTTAFRSAVTIEGGAAKERDYFDLAWFRQADTPPIEVHLIGGNSSSPGGIGEVGYPTVAPAVANAIFAAGGGRLRSLPLRDFTVLPAHGGPAGAPTSPPPTREPGPSATRTAAPPPTATPAPPTQGPPAPTTGPSVDVDTVFLPNLGRG